MSALAGVVSSLVLETPAAAPEVARQHFLSRLAVEADPADVYADLVSGVESFVVIDARSPESYAKGHIPGAVNFPHRTMNAETTASLSKEKVYVTYCDGIGCNGSLKGALKLAALGFKVKEMVGGIEWWARVDGYPVVIGELPGTLKPGAVQCDC